MAMTPEARREYQRKYYRKHYGKNGDRKQLRLDYRREYEPSYREENREQWNFKSRKSLWRKENASELESFVEAIYLFRKMIQ